MREMTRWVEGMMTGGRAEAGLADSGGMGQRVARKIDPLNLWRPFMKLYGHLAQQPGLVAQQNYALWTDLTRLCWANMRRMAGDLSVQPVISPAADDKRFKGELWTDQIVFDCLKQTYLLVSRWCQDLAASDRDLSAHERAQVQFFTRQFVSALSPSNFALSNPEVIKTTVEQGGANLIRGLQHILRDLDPETGALRVRLTDEGAFEVGVNVATTPGQVIFETEMMQLIQYNPTTEQVGRRPLLVCPPWINKFYILDLQPKNSLIRWAVDQGHTVFVISWVNPDDRHRDKGFDDYMTDGLLAAMEAVGQATGEPDLNLVGYCLGGTLSACTLAWLRARGDARVASATFLATLVDFEQAGELTVFIDGPQLESLDERMDARGYLDGKDMALTFNMLRENDLIWSMVIDQYLLGHEPLPFDLLYWNGDSTRMPQRMHSFYLREMYLHNLLVEPGGIELAGEPIDLSRIDMPVYLLSTREDHIAPWHNTYRATQIYSGEVTYVLSGSGHIAGVVNPPTKQKYGYLTNPALPAAPEAWLAEATAHEGSWWPHWSRWLSTHRGDEVPARWPGDGALAPIEPAPGRYVKVKGV